MKQAIHTSEAPQAIGPYSQAVKIDGWIYCSGQIPLDPATGSLVTGNIATQTHQVLNNLAKVLAAAGANFSHVVKTTIYLKDLGDFQTVNAVYSEYFQAPFPARVTIQAAKLPLDAGVEIDAVAKVP